MNAFRKAILAATCVGSLVAVAAPALAQTTLRAVMHSDLKILDPIWTTAYIVRNHGYMIYDTLLAQDEKGEIKPQMVEKYEAAADGKGYTFTLRDGLLWHDGKPVTSEDCIASIKRWAVKDSLGQKMMTFVDSIDAVDAKTFTIKLKEPTGLVLLGLSKPSSNVPFMMPKRVADTDPNKQIEDFTGSGPFVFVRDEWKPGDKTVYVKFDKYKPRAEPASGLAGGKVAKVDRIEWRAISDAQQAVNALQKGEIDYIEQPSHDLLGTLKKDANISIVEVPQIKAQYVFRPNHLHKPFDNPKVRQALWYAFNQEDFLMATIGDENYIKACKALFVCDTQVRHHQGNGRASHLQRQEGAGAPEGSRLRRHACAADALHRPQGPDQPGAGGEIADGEGRLQGRHAVDGLADACCAPRQEGSAERRWLECLPDGLGHGRRDEPGLCRLCEFGVRQGFVRMALRPRDGKAARRLRAHSRSGEAERDRRSGPEAQYRDHGHDPGRRIRLSRLPFARTSRGS